MTSITKALILIALVCGECFVFAKELTHDSLKEPKGLDFPQGCLANKRLPCAIKSTGRKLSLQLDTVKVVLKKNSTVIWKDKGKYQVVAGEVWFSSSAPESVEIQSEFGYFQAGAEGLNVFVRKSAEMMEIYPLIDGVSVFPLGEGVESGFLLPAGYRSFLTSVGRSGVAHYEIPVAANLKGLIESWAPMFDGTPQELSGFLSSYREVWAEAVEAGAYLHNQIASREIASEKQRQARRKQRLKSIKDEEIYLNKLFRRKNYLD